MVKYSYDSWGKLISTTGSLASTVGVINPYRYRGYRYDTETGFYYLNSRYYDPAIGRFINADGYASTGQGLNGNNMFAYCGNNPVMRSDPSGMLWKEIGDFFKNIGNAIGGLFGSEVTLVNQVSSEIEYCPPIVDMIATVKMGEETNTIISKHGDSSKPFSVYAKGRSDNYLLSSTGININVERSTFNISLGLDNLGISRSTKSGNNIISSSFKINASKLKFGFELSDTVVSKWDSNTSVTTYTNASITAWGIIAVYKLVTTGQWAPSLSPQRVG